MRTHLKVCGVLSIALVIGFVGLRRTAAQEGSVRAAIAAGNKKFIDGAAKGDASLIAAAYTADAEAFPPNADVVRGRPAIEKLWKSVLDSGISTIDLATKEVESSGNIAYEVGTYEMKAKDGKVAEAFEQFSKMK